MQKSDNWPEHTIPARTQTFAEVTLPLTSTMSNMRPCLTSVPSVELASYCLGRSQHLFHSGIVSAPRTLFECLLTLSLPASWHWPPVCGIARHCVTRTACMRVPVQRNCGPALYGFIRNVMVSHSSSGMWGPCADIGNCADDGTQANHKVPQPVVAIKLSKTWQKLKAARFVLSTASQLEGPVDR